MTESASKGVLYVVATPIGNLEDITYRAVRVLKEADLIACEDTRQTRKLLDHYGITGKVISYHEHNEQARAEELVQRLREGAAVAQVSDAGMPGISDPGYRLITLAIESGISVVPVPGPAAAITALAASGLPTDAFEFRGFLPAKSGQRRTALESLSNSEQTAIFYEAPHRIRETLADIVAVLGPQRPVVIARELTKIHEEFLRGSAAQLLAIATERELKGEITLLIGKSQAPQQANSTVDLRQRLQQLMTEQNLDEKAALKLLARETGLSKSAVYREVQRNAGRAKK
ncbi:MAG TPA: 16S rRNA (cytidine(1402)-2'-O)-methyltransferase [Candidatus Limnocylindrales bacterium]|nr:16S rRNA (cytidine(1402)-2'-O)-methyltransferase [Candidatus Limnocylindrales bacterium]